jgi:hypothetical protein
MKTIQRVLICVALLSAFALAQSIPSRFPRIVSGTIPAGGSLSGPIDLKGCTVARFNFSTLASSAVLTFQAAEGAGYKEMVDFFNTAITFPASTGNIDVSTDVVSWYARNQIRVRSGTPGSPVAQANEVNFQFICKD